MKGLRPAEEQPEGRLAQWAAGLRIAYPQMRVLKTLAEHADGAEPPVRWPGHAVLARCHGRTIPWVSIQVRRLKERGLISVVQSPGGGRPLTYELNLDADGHPGGTPLGLEGRP